MLYLAEPSNIDSSFLYDDYDLYLHNNDSLTCGASLLPFLRNCLAHTALNSKSVSATAVKQDDIPFGVCVHPLGSHF